MVVTVAVVVATHNLAIGVVVGVLTAMVALRPAGRAPGRGRRERARPRRRHAASTPCTASCSSPPATTSSTQFDYAGDPDRVVIDLSRAHIWDASSVAALDAITTKYAARGKTVEIIGPQRRPAPSCTGISPGSSRTH